MKGSKRQRHSRRRTTDRRKTARFLRFGGLVAGVGISLISIALLSEDRRENAIGLSSAFFRMWQTEHELRFDPGTYLRARINLSAYQQMLVPFGDVDYMLTEESAGGSPQALLGSNGEHAYPVALPAGMDQLRLWDFAGGSSETIVRGSAAQGLSDLTLESFRSPTLDKAFGLHNSVWGSGGRLSGWRSFRGGSTAQADSGSGPKPTGQIGLASGKSRGSATWAQALIDEESSRAGDTSETGDTGVGHAGRDALDMLADLLDTPLPDLGVGEIFEELLDAVPSGLLEPMSLVSNNESAGQPLLAANQASVPEPGTFALLALGLGFLALFRKR